MDAIRVVIPIWGAEYSERFLTCCWPSLKANWADLPEGSILHLGTRLEDQSVLAPAFAGFPVEWSFVTSTGNCYQMASQVYQAALLASAPLDQPLILLTADHLLARGVFATLVRLLIDGARVVWMQALRLREEDM